MNNTKPNVIDISSFIIWYTNIALHYNYSMCDVNKPIQRYCFLKFSLLFQIECNSISNGNEDTGKKPKQFHLLIKFGGKTNDLPNQNLNNSLNKNTKLRPLLPKVPIIFADNNKLEMISVTPNAQSSTTSLESNAKPDLPINSTLSNLTTDIAVDASTKAVEAPVFLETATTESKKLLLYEKLCQRQKATIATYRNRIKNSERKFRKLEKHVKDITDSGTSIYEIFNADQIAALQRRTISKSTKFLKWSDATISRALRLKFTCGSDGYEELLKQNIPLPSEKTLQRRLQSIKFEPGTLNQVFEFLKVKIDCFNNNERDCCMILEEMEIVPETTYDSKSDKYYGEITLPQYSGNATHVQVVILAGINTRWKQIVAYYFTGGSIEDSVFKEIINNLLKRTKEINLNVISITTDMDASNQAIWGTLNMNLGRHRTVKNTIDHPLDATKKIYIFADVPKLFKQFKLMLIMNKIITIPEYFQDKYQLPTNIISSTHIFDLISFQIIFRFRLVPKATFADLLPYDFDKATTFTSKSKNVKNVDISSALKLVAKLHKQPEYLTTAWFLDVLEKWFELMTAKSPVTALSKYREETYNGIVSFLYDFMEIVDYMEVGGQKVWKTIQTGALISTKSMIQLQNILLNQKNYNFLLTGRFSSNYLENLFNVLKAKKITSNAQNVQQNLKILCVAQYLKCTKSSCIDEDDRAIFQRSNFVGIAQESTIQEDDSLDMTQDETNENVNLYDDINKGKHYFAVLNRVDVNDAVNSTQSDFLDEEYLFDDATEVNEEEI